MIANYNLRKQILIFFLLLVSSFSFGQVSGSIDNTFLPEDRGSSSGESYSDENTFESISLQSDGKAIISGNFYKYDNIITGRVARINTTNGGLDETFSPVLTNGVVNHSVVLPNDKIIISGTFIQVNGISHNRIARLNADGTLDTSFNIGTGFNDKVREVVIQVDGKIVVIGDFSSYNNITSNSIVRLNTDGTLDTSFNIGSGVVGQFLLFDIALQNDGKIILSGGFTTFNNIPSKNLVRLNTDGTVDNTFIIGSSTNSRVFTIATQNNGQLLIYGNFTSYNNTPINHIARLNANGTLDTTFNPGLGLGNVQMDNIFINDLVIQNDNKVLVCGSFEEFNGLANKHLVRLNVDGSLDNSFSIGTGFYMTVNISSYVDTIRILDNGKILALGRFDLYNGTTRNSIALLSSNGSLDNVFNASYGADAWVLDSRVLNDGKIFISGGFNNFYQTSKSKIAKLNSDGTLDNSFNPPSMPITNSFIRSFEIQNDNKIIITRNSSTFVNNIYAETGKIERLNTDGSLDNSFNTGVGANNVLSKVVLHNNKIYVIGNFTTYNGSNVNRVIRLNMDGSIDTSFNIGSGPNIGVLDIIILNDGKILICGNFTSVNGIARNRIARLNNNGTLDTTFSGGGSSSSINSIALQSDGKIIFGSSGVGRLLANGANDGFSVDPAGLTIFKVVVQNDNKVIAGGFRVGTSSEKRFFKYNSDGTYDTSFDTGIGITDGLVSTISLQTDGKIIVGGTFLSYGVSKDRIIRINNSIESLSTNTFSNKEFLFYPNPTNSIVNISATNEIINQINVYDMFGRLLKSKKSTSNNEQINIQELPSGMYLIDVKTNGGNKAVKIIKN